MFDYQQQFIDDFSYSLSDDVTNFWLRAHSQAFRDFQGMKTVDDLTLQRQGFDRLIKTPSRIISVEEKVDRTTYTNIAFEVESTEGYSRGWAEKDLQSDVFAYGFINQGVVYYFSMTELLGVWREHQSFWKRKYGQRKVWASRAIVTPVPVDVVTSTVRHVKVVRDI